LNETLKFSDYIETNHACDVKVGPTDASNSSSSSRSVGSVSVNSQHSAVPLSVYSPHTSASHDQGVKPTLHIHWRETDCLRNILCRSRSAPYHVPV